MNLRQQRQQAFDRSGEPLIVGDISHCPLPPETLAALGPDSPYVVQVYGSGLTGEVYRLRIAGKEYNLKKRRAVAGVANLNGQLSFLNEVQRRQALQRLKDNPVTAPRFTHIVPTLYADYRLGILLSPLIGAAAMALSSFSVVANALRLNRVRLCGLSFFFALFSGAQFRCEVFWVW